MTKHLFGRTCLVYIIYQSNSKLVPVVMRGTGYFCVGAYNYWPQIILKDKSRVSLFSPLGTMRKMVSSIPWLFVGKVEHQLFKLG